MTSAPTDVVTEIDGEALSAELIASKLLEWSRLSPDPMAPDSATWGHSRAGQLRDALAGTPWKAEFDAAVIGLLDGDLLAMWLAAALAPFGSLPPRKLNAAFQAAERHVASLTWVDPGALAMQRTIGSQWQHAIAAGMLRFLPAYRERLLDPAAAVLLGAALVWDHAATLDRFDELVGEGDDAVLRFGTAVRAVLRRSEAEGLRNALSAAQRLAPTAVRGRCIEALTWYIDRNVLPDAGPVRWQRR